MSNFSNTWEVLRLFLIPIGGGIPAGVLKAQSLNFQWPVMLFLYFVSDVILAFCFEPIMLLAIKMGRRSPKMARVNLVFKKSMDRTMSHYGSSLGPLALITLAFGVDPMTGRAAAAVSGHGFISGWLLAIAGDMVYFSLLMVSTLFLNNILGDGTWTTIIILAGMMIVPVLIRRLKDRKKSAV